MALVFNVVRQKYLYGKKLKKPHSGDRNQKGTVLDLKNSYVTLKKEQTEGVLCGPKQIRGRSLTVPKKISKVDP